MEGNGGAGKMRPLEGWGKRAVSVMQIVPCQTEPRTRLALQRSLANRPSDWECLARVRRDVRTLPPRSMVDRNKGKGKPG